MLQKVSLGIVDSNDVVIPSHLHKNKLLLLARDFCGVLYITQ